MRQAAETGIAWCLVVALFLWAGYVVVSGNGVGVDENWFFDTDDATRAVRVLAILNGGSWFDSTIHQVYGGLLSHWTRPSDIVVLLVAVPLHLAGIAPETAILQASFVTPPILLGIFAAAWIWAVRPLARPGSHDWAILGLAPIGALTGMGWFAPMRIDHHALIFTWTVLLLGLALRLGAGSHGRRMPVVVGACCALGIWIGVELFLYIGCLFSVLAAGWVFTGEASKLRTNVAVAWVTAAGVMVALMLERGGGAFTTWDLDRISLFHLSVFVAVAIGWSVIQEIDERLDRHSGNLERYGAILRRLGIGAVGGLLPFAAILLLHSGILLGQVDSGIDPLYKELRLGGISEGQNVFDLDMVDKFGWKDALRTGLGRSLTAVVGLVVLGLMFLRLRSWSTLGALGVWIAIYMTWLIAWQGWPSYYYMAGLGLFGGIGVAIVASRISEAVFRERICRVIGGMTFLAATIVSQAVLFGLEINDEESGAAEVCSRKMAAKQLEGAGIGPGDLVATSADMGPGIMWVTGATVMSIPNHHYQPGFGMAYEIFTRNSDEEALAMIEEHGITALLVCRGYGRYFGLASDQGDTFGKRLLAGDAPAWLEPIETDEHQKAYRVIGR